MILTHRLGGDYGSDLQNHSLQHALEQSGYDIMTTFLHTTSVKKRLMMTLKQSARNVLHISRPSASSRPINNVRLIIVKTGRFENVNVRALERGVFKKGALNGYNVLVVGRDQVWRQKYISVDNLVFSIALNYSATIRAINKALQQ